MRATVMYGAGDVRIEDVPDPALHEPTDAVVRVLRSCICGSDLWPYRSMWASEHGQRMEHDFLGVVEETGAEVSGLKAGDLVVAPFVWADSTCDFCREGLQTSWRHGDLWGGDLDGGQGEAVRCRRPRARWSSCRPMPTRRCSGRCPHQALTRKRETAMPAWTSDELDKFAAVGELRIAFLRRDGTLARPRTIWVVRLGDELYVRSVNGRDSAWFRGSQVSRQGHIQAGGVSKDVTFAEPGDGLGDELDAAYRAKYRYSPAAVSHITSPQARSATLRLVPRQVGP